MWSDACRVIWKQAPATFISLALIVFLLSTISTNFKVFKLVELPFWHHSDALISRDFAVVRHCKSDWALITFNKPAILYENLNKMT